MSMLFNAQERSEIESTIGQIELQTAGELVVSVVSRSDDYGTHRAAATAFWSVACAILLHYFLPTLAPDIILLLQLPVGIALWLLSGCGTVLRLLVPNALLDAAVRRRAFQMFAERGVHQTRDASGLLIMVSKTEHRVVILGDRGIHQRIGTQGWHDHVKTITQGLRTGQAKDAVIHVLRSLGDVLATHFPRRSDDVNELPDTVEQSH